MNELDNIAKNYNELHNDWRNLLGLLRLNEFNNFEKFAFKSENVIEVGLGDGAFTELLAQKFKRVFAVDGSNETISFVKKRLSAFNNIDYVLSLIEDLKFEQSLDNMVLGHILEHLDKPVDVLKNVKRLLHKDSVLYLSVPNSQSLHRQVAVKMGLLKKTNELNETDFKLGHRRVYSPKTFANDIKNAGLQIVKFGGSMLKPLSNAQIERNWTKEMIAGFIELGEDYPELCGDIYIIAKIA
jgi:2-polyprenyl-3-methyl-5-hydroxy-6-metoxy-1,4-benzoquinol methylase